MKVHIPGFPQDVSGPIEMPDIGELLMYPAFQGIAAEDFLKHATEFQRELFYKIPLKNDRKTVLIRSGVWLLEPGTRSHVNTYGDWHIDGNTDFAHIHPDERVYILCSSCSALTEFNANALEVESDPAETRDQLTRRISRNPGQYGVVARKIEGSHIYMFENHLHRAVDPRRIEFRFFLRVRETDIPPTRRIPLREVLIRTVAGTSRINIEFTKGKVSIYIPNALNQKGEVEPQPGG